MIESILSRDLEEPEAQGWKPRCQCKCDRPGSKVRVYGARGPGKGDHVSFEVEVCMWKGLVASCSHER